MSWKADVKIVDNVNGVVKNIEYRFNKISKYIYLFNELENLYDPKCKCSIIIYSIFLEQKRIVNNLDKYILNGDQIEIVLNLEVPVYMLTDIKSGDVIKSDKNMKTLYKLYYEHLENTMDCELLLIRRYAGKLSLIDVLDSPRRHYNECLNRLIHKYNF